MIVDGRAVALLALAVRPVVVALAHALHGAVPTSDYAAAPRSPGTPGTPAVIDCVRRNTRR
ncbi:hypothetical protein DPMN_122350 [Dreissena polymorpha]|uniref:Uncharacterized protein n=1 Tax=Dreissena polymorpha TaxID=45954 RepID=A0A9D4GSB9_DREPO|nr:hypothetical protein DPMN_122350 [Dreissena polymorpha]